MRGHPSTSGTAPSGGAIRVDRVVKRFGDVTAVDGIDLDIASGEFFSLLGASGCGKTTTLRMIAGFERPDEGRILLDDVDLAGTPPHRRPVNTVFQAYALFPFLSVAENVAFGLKYQKLSKGELTRRVDEALALTAMTGFAARRPAQLSGGQQQRVALARALVLDPRVLLLDEPLGALDAQLRKQLQLELRGLQRRVGKTFVYVTHDQDEALTMSDRIAVLADGRVEQIGTPSEIYAQPATTYVARFIGSANIFEVDVLERGADRSVVCRLLDQPLHASSDVPVPLGPGAVVIRPERITIDAADALPRPGENSLEGVVEDVVFHGATTQVRIRLAMGMHLAVAVPNVEGPVTVRFPPGTPVRCTFRADAVRLLQRTVDPAAVADVEPTVEPAAEPAESEPVGVPLGGRP
jgi:spermidine/putrescine transport system ATP-binding protein